MLSEQQQRTQSLWQQAELHASRKEWPEAITCFEVLLTQSPDDPKVLVQLSYLASLSGHYRAARDYALRANEVRPVDPEVIKELIARLRTFNAAQALHACVDRLQLDRTPIPLLLAFAAQFSNLNEQTRALRLLDEARRGDPDYPVTLIARSQVLMYLGRFAEAEADVLRAMRRAPEIAQASWLLARLRKQTLESNHVAHIRSQLQRPDRRPAEIALLADALHKELDDIGDHAAAWDALQQACRAKRSTLNYDAGASRALITALIEQSSLSAVPTTPNPANSRIPVFIVGMHRSGTTLLEQMLDGHSDVHGIGELYDFTSQMRYATDHHCRGVIDSTIVERSSSIDFAEVGRGYLAGIEWRLGKERYFSDKLPSNFLNIGSICQALPQAKILHMVRDPIETCFSNLRELFSDANAYSYDQIELADYFLQYQRLMRHWHAAYPGRILDVDYAELTRDPERVLRRVCSFCGLDFEPGMLDLSARKRGVSTASAVQVREKVVAREKPKWEPYATYLQPMIQRLQSVQNSNQV